MKTQTIILVIAIGVIVVGLTSFGYFNAIPTVDDISLSRPEIKIIPDVFDFGEIEYGDIVKQTFIVKNIGDEILEIKRLATSCGCTTAEINIENISPNETAELLVTYDSGAMSGPHGMGRQERIIYIKSNDPLTPQVEVQTQAYVK